MCWECVSSRDLARVHNLCSSYQPTPRLHRNPAFPSRFVGGAFPIEVIPSIARICRCRARQGPNSCHAWRRTAKHEAGLGGLRIATLAWAWRGHHRAQDKVRSARQITQHTMAAHHDYASESCTHTPATRKVRCAAFDLLHSPQLRSPARRSHASRIVPAWCSSGRSAAIPAPPVEVAIDHGVSTAAGCCGVAHCCCGRWQGRSILASAPSRVANSAIGDGASRPHHDSRAMQAHGAGEQPR
eukprot:2037800-Rhodomonas_salina.3